MKLIDGKALSNTIKEEIAQEVEAIKKQGGKTPHLAAVLIGDDPASAVYVRNKVRACEKVGFKSTLVRRDADTSEEEVLQIVKELNIDDDYLHSLLKILLEENTIEITNSNTYKIKLNA